MISIFGKHSSGIQYQRLDNVQNKKNETAKFKSGSGTQAMAGIQQQQSTRAQLSSLQKQYAKQVKSNPQNLSQLKPQIGGLKAELQAKQAEATTRKNRITQQYTAANKQVTKTDRKYHQQKSTERANNQAAYSETKRDIKSRLQQNNLKTITADIVRNTQMEGLRALASAPNRSEVMNKNVNRLKGEHLKKAVKDIAKKPNMLPSEAIQKLQHAHQKDQGALLKAGHTTEQNLNKQKNKLQTDFSKKRGRFAESASLNALRRNHKDAEVNRAELRGKKRQAKVEVRNIKTQLRQLHTLEKKIAAQERLEQKALQRLMQRATSAPRQGV